MRFHDHPGWTGLAITRGAIELLAADPMLAPCNAELMNGLRLLGRYVLTLEERVARLEAGAVAGGAKAAAKSEPQASGTSRAVRPTEPAPPPSILMPDEAAGMREIDMACAAIPLSAAVLAVLVEDGGEWTTAELADQVQRERRTASKVTTSTVSVAVASLCARGLIARQKDEAGVYRHRAVAADGGGT